MDQTTPPPPQSHVVPPRRGWWSRNWKWFVPTGCLSLLVLFAAFVATIFLVAFGALKSTDVYKTAVQRAKANPAVVAALGSPISEGLFLSGNTNTSGGSGKADISIPISGPKGKATIYAVATKSAGTWTYQTLAVEIAATKERINLNQSDAAAGDDEQ